MNSDQVLDPIKPDVALQHIELALLNESNISDYFLLVRRTKESSDELIVYIVPQGPINQDQLKTRLQGLLDNSELEIHFVPLFKLPRTTDGLVDEQALAKIPVLDDRFLKKSEQKLRMLDNIKAAAIVRIPHQPPEERRYHLSDLLPSDSSEHHHPEFQTTTQQERSTSTGALPDALVDGGALKDHDFVQRTTLLDLLHKAAIEYGNQRIRFVLSDGTVDEWSYTDLWNNAKSIYAGLLTTGLKAGDKVVFQLRDNRDILSTFWACQMGGYIPVIVEVPTSYQAGNQILERVIGLLQLLKNPLVIADNSSATAWAEVKALQFNEKLRTHCIEALKQYPAPENNFHTAQPEDIAFFNLSSGSTGIPKCIMLSHRNLLSRGCGTNQLCGYSSSDVILNWLPFDHIGSISDWHIRCVLLGCDLVYVDKDYVLGNPVNWLHLMDRFRATHSWAPNFAFSLINKQLESLQSPTWDLSCVKGLLTAGEAVSDNSVQGFIGALGKFGLKSTAVQPAFGMAELGSGITYFVPTETNPLRFHTVSKPSMGSTIERVDENHPAATRFADLGPPIPSVSLRIVDNENHILPMETVGRLQINGDVVFQGYFENPAANASSFQTDGWFNTGDLGFLSQGNLVLTGREKETIIIKGSNYYSHDIEDTVEHVEGIEPSYTAASGVRRAQDREEKLAIFFVPVRADHEAELIRAIRTQIANKYGISPTYLIPLEKHQIPKTAIGKIQRTQLKQRLEGGEFDAIIKRVDLILGNANTLPSWFYRSIWMPKQAVPAARRFEEGTVMILMDDSGLGIALANQLQSRQKTCVMVTPGSRFECRDDYHYEINLRSREDFLELFRNLKTKQITITQIVSLIDYHLTESSAADNQESTESYPINVDSFFCLLQSIFKFDESKLLRRILWVANDCHCVESGDAGSPLKAMMTGFTRTLSSEHPDLECTHIDLSSADHTFNQDILCKELEKGVFIKDPVVSYRNRQRYVSKLEKLDIVSNKLDKFELKREGVYLVTGGLGGLGFELSRMLGLRYNAKILILGLSPLVEPTPENDLSLYDHNRWQRYQKLQDDGVECTYIQADVSDHKAVHEQIKQVEHIWGRSLDGIFHLAGLADERPLKQETVKNFAQLARPKCKGIIVVGDLLKERQGTFLVAFSSVNATFGGANAGSYSATNVYVESYCRQLFHSGWPVICYSWSLWDGLGMSSDNTTNHIAAAKGFRPISLEEGLNSLLALLYSGQPEAIIGLDAAKNPIRLSLKDNYYEQASVVGFLELKNSTLKQAIPKTITLNDRFNAIVDCRLELIEAMPLLADGRIDKDKLISLTGSDHKIKKKPENDIEASLIEIWRDLLQVTDIGTQDNFFELGGDSLLTVQLVALIAKTFKQQIPASTVFYAPTIEQLAAALNQNVQIPDFFSLVPIKASGNKLPLYIIQSDSWELVDYLDSTQPVYGLNYGVGGKSLNSKLQLPDTLEEIAAHFISEIRLLQPTGPYYIIGHSNAGILAYEMAQQLIAQQQHVDMLGMIDTYNPDEFNTPPMGMRDKLLKLAKLSLTQDAEILRNWLKSRISKVKLHIFTKKSEQPFLDRAMHLYRRYEPKPYPGSVTYFKCINQIGLKAIRNDEEKWQKLAPEGFQVHLIPCHHGEVLVEPHVKILAEKISYSLSS